MTRHWKIHSVESVVKGEKCAAYILKLVSTIFHYFQKNSVFPGYFERNTLKRNLTYSCFIFSLFHEHLFLLLKTAILLKTSCFEKITVCVIGTMLATLSLVQIYQARREVNNKSSTNQDKIATVLRTYLND